jgi:hypothetical protein
VDFPVSDRRYGDYRHIQPIYDGPMLNPHIAYSSENYDREQSYD